MDLCINYDFCTNPLDVRCLGSNGLSANGAPLWVSPARAQEPRRVIGVLTGFDIPSVWSAVAMPAFSQGLKDTGFVEGRNLNIEIRQAGDGHYDRLPSLASELVGRDVTVIFTTDV